MIFCPSELSPISLTETEKKRAHEELGLEYLACCARGSGNNIFADRINMLWKEYEEGGSHVSQIVRQVDKLQALYQAYLYTRRYPDLSVKLSDFKAHENLITDPWLKQRAVEVIDKWGTASRKTPTIFIFVIGGPGVGKGTQCERAAKEFGWEHISVGDLLRRERAKPDSIYKEFIGRSFQKGVPVPPMLAVDLLSTELQRIHTAEKSTHGIILDGFPLTCDQLTAFEEQVRQ